MDVALSPEKCEIKGLDSPVNGEADVLIFPTLEAANIFYKSVTILSGGTLAANVAGAIAPIMLTSRADDADSKFYSVAMGALNAGK